MQSSTTEHFQEDLQKSLNKVLNSARRNNRALQNLKDPSYWKKQEAKLINEQSKSWDILAGWIVT